MKKSFVKHTEIFTSQNLIMKSGVNKTNDIY